jgi:hypothetical protein
MADLCWVVPVLNFILTPTILTQVFMDFQSASKQGLLNLLCGAGNFSKIWSACSQHEIQ